MEFFTLCGVGVTEGNESIPNRPRGYPMVIYEDFEIEETVTMESDFSASSTIETLAQAYFRLCAQLKTAREWFERRRIIKQQKMLEDEIFAMAANTELALHKKAHVLLHILEGEDGFRHSKKQLKSYSVSLAEDALALSGGARRGTGPYKPECIVNYYSWMTPDDPASQQQHAH